MHACMHACMRASTSYFLNDFVLECLHADMHIPSFLLLRWQQKANPKKFFFEIKKIGAVVSNFERTPLFHFLFIYCHYG